MFFLAEGMHNANDITELMQSETTEARDKNIRQKHSQTKDMHTIKTVYNWKYIKGLNMIMIYTIDPKE